MFKFEQVELVQFLGEAYANYTADSLSLWNHSLLVPRPRIVKTNVDLIKFSTMTLSEQKCRS